MTFKEFIHQFTPHTRYLCQPTTGVWRYILPPIGVVLVVLAWQIIYDSGKVNHAYLPSPKSTVIAFAYSFQDAPPRVADKNNPGETRPLKSTEAGDSWLTSKWDAFTHTTAWRGADASVARIMKAVGWACLFGIPLGILLGAFGFIESLFSLFLLPLGSLPISALLSVFALFYTLSEMEAFKIAFLTFGTVVYVIPTTKDAVRAVSPAIIEKAVDLGFRPWGMLRHFIIPAALPRIYQGIRICARIAWSYVIMAETYHVSTGLGATIANAQRLQNAPRVYAYLLFIILLTVLTEALFSIPPKYLPILRTEEKN